MNNSRHELLYVLNKLGIKSADSYFVSKNYMNVLGEMMKHIQIAMPMADIKPGSVLMNLLEATAHGIVANGK